MCNLTRIVNHSALGHCSSAHPLAQRFAFQEFRHDVRRAFMRLDVVDYENVGMIQRPGGACFLLETAQALRVTGER